MTQAAALIKKEKYDASINSSKSAASLASDAISKYEQELEDNTALAKFKAASLVKSEEKRHATESARLNNLTKEHIVHAGDNL